MGRNCAHSDLFVGDVGAQAGDDVLGELGEEGQVVEVVDGPLLTTVVDDGAGHIIIDVGMALEVVERESVDLERGLDFCRNDEENRRFHREIIDLAQLVDRGITTQAATIVEDASGKEAANAGDGLIDSRVEGIEVDGLAGL